MEGAGRLHQANEGVAMLIPVRSLILIVLAVGISGAIRAAEPAERAAAVKAIEEAGATVQRDKDDLSKIVRVSFGCHYCAPALLPRLAELPELRQLNLRLDGRVTERDLEPLRQLKALEWLLFHHSDEGGDELLAQVPHLPALKTLQISRVPVSDRGLEHLHGAKQLKTVRLSGCQGITPAGIQALKSALPAAEVKN
jgi:hypothetical protein